MNKDYMDKIISILDDASEHESLDDYSILLDNVITEAAGRMDTLDCASCCVGD